MFTYNVWDTIDIIFRREHRKTALHHSSLSLSACVCVCGGGGGGTVSKWIRSILSLDSKLTIIMSQLYINNSGTVAA